MKTTAEALVELEQYEAISNMTDKQKWVLAANLSEEWRMLHCLPDKDSRQILKVLVKTKKE